MNPFRKYGCLDDEEVKFGAVRRRSHDNWTFHKELPANFDRKKVLPINIVKGLRDFGAEIIEFKRLEAKRMAMVKSICHHMVKIVVHRAGKILFDTPPGSEQTDSFAEDFDIEYEKVDVNLKENSEDKLEFQELKTGRSSFKTLKKVESIVSNQRSSVARRSSLGMSKRSAQVRRSDMRLDSEANDNRGSIQSLPQYNAIRGGGQAVRDVTASV